MQNPWITQGIIKSIKHRDNLYYYRWKKTISRVNKAGDPRKHEEYRTFRNKPGNIIKAQKQLYYTKKFEKMYPTNALPGSLSTILEELAPSTNA